jgi:hypothetical protein
VAVRRHWNNQNSSACKLRFPHEKEFFQKWPEVWARAFENVHQHCQKLKKFKELHSQEASKY